MKKKEKKKSSFAVLMHYAGGHRYYSYASAVLAVISAWIAHHKRDTQGKT